MDQEALEAGHTGVPELRQLRHISRHDSAPESHIDVALAPGSCHFFLETCEGSRRGNTIKRHVHQCSDTAGSRGARGGSKSFPIRAPWFVDVHVGVYQSRHQHGRISNFEKIQPWRTIIEGRDGVDTPVLNMYAGRLY